MAPKKKKAGIYPSSLDLLGWPDGLHFDLKPRPTDSLIHKLAREKAKEIVKLCCQRVEGTTGYALSVDFGEGPQQFRLRDKLPEDDRAELWCVLECARDPLAIDMSPAKQLRMDLLLELAEKLRDEPPSFEVDTDAANLVRKIKFACQQLDEQPPEILMVLEAMLLLGFQIGTLAERLHAREFEPFAGTGRQVHTASEEHRTAQKEQLGSLQGKCWEEYLRRVEDGVSPKTIERNLCTTFQRSRKTIDRWLEPYLARYCQSKYREAEDSGRATGEVVAGLARKFKKHRGKIRRLIEES